MNEHHEPPLPPPPRVVVFRTTTDIFKKTNSVFSTGNNLLMLLVLSFILLSQRLNIELGTRAITSYIDNEPSLKSIIYRILGPPKPATATTTVRRHRDGHFLQLTRVGTLDDDFFAGDDELDRRFFESLPKPQLNASSFRLDSFDPQFGYSNFVSDNGIRASETVRSSAKTPFKSIEIIEKEENVAIDAINESAPVNETAESNTDFYRSLKRFDLEHHDFTALLIPIGAFSVSYLYLMFSFVLTHSIVHGVIFVLVLNDFCNRENSFVMTYSNGCFLGLTRSSTLFLLKWQIRDAFTQLLGIWFFGQIKDPYSLFKIFVRLKFMPYATMAPWVKGFEIEGHGFGLTWSLVNHIMSFALTMSPWIVMADSRKNWREIAKEGWDLLSLMIHLAMNLKSYETLVCGPLARSILARTFGDSIAITFQSFMEVYFMVAWMIYFLSLKSIDANSSGQPFGQPELEAMLEGVR